MALKRKFAMTSVAPVRPAAFGCSPSPAKAGVIPKASQLAVEQSRPAIQRKLASAPVVVCIYKVTDKAADAWSSITDTSAALFQIQIDHAARTSVAFDIVRVFNDFLKDAHTENRSPPQRSQTYLSTQVYTSS